MDFSTLVQVHGTQRISVGKVTVQLDTGRNVGITLSLDELRRLVAEAAEVGYVRKGLEYADVLNGSALCPAP